MHQNEVNLFFFHFYVKHCVVSMWFASIVGTLSCILLHRWHASDIFKWHKLRFIIRILLELKIVTAIINEYDNHYHHLPHDLYDDAVSCHSYFNLFTVFYSNCEPSNRVKSIQIRTKLFVNETKTESENRSLKIRHKWKPGAVLYGFFVTNLRVMLLALFYRLLNVSCSIDG